jgi:hypothetical protein
MWEEDVLPRALQNHLLQARHRTTLLGLWMPQYLSFFQYMLPRPARVMNIRAGMCRQLLLFFWFRGIVCAIDLMAHETLGVVLSQEFRLVIVVLPSSGTLGQAQDTLVRINGRDVITGIDGGCGVRNQVVSHIAEGLHDERSRRKGFSVG